MPANRSDNRSPDTLRPITVVQRFTKFAPGSVLISCGDTRVLCTASIEEKVPPFLRDKGQGWVTAEYSLLPGSTSTRCQREVNKGKPSGRTQEIQRLIGRALRSIVDLQKLGERTIHIDCDVLQADGGTRTTAITGSMIALSDAIQSLIDSGKLPESPIREYLAAVSVGIVDGECVLDLCYEEDSQAQVDMNVVMTESGKIVEIQGTAETAPFTTAEMTKMMALAEKGIGELIGTVKEAALVHESVS